ncbi:proteasome regulatory particle base subunit RPN1 [Aspergillus lucknowensis]|uniref:Armadillo-type protein n=1 Tax=Aspergillus lucknowensis TaxID=176173 RepID=A0ABR4LMP7_9EURO
MPTSKWPFFASEELGKKNDDHRPMTHPEQQWRPRSWKLPRRRRILLLPVILYLLYIFFKNMPTDLPPARERLKPTIPSSQHVLPDAAPPPGTSLSNPPPRDESSSGNSDELYYNGKLKFYELGKSLKLFQASSNHGGKAASHSAVFAAASLRSVSDLLPLACSMANRKLNKVHFLLMGRDEVSIEGIQSVNGVSRADCPINWHDARVDYGRWSTDARMEHAVAVVLPYIQAYLRPEILITQGDSWEDPFFMRGIQKAKELGIPHIKLPHAARDLMWLAALDSNALRSWNDIQVEFLIYAAPDSAGSLIRLLRSLEHADFLGYTPSLTIELPSRVDPQLLGFLQELKWLPNTSSKVTIRRRVQLHTMDPNEASLRAVEAFYPRNPTLSHVLVLSPDVELAPSFFQYLIYTLLNYRYSTSSRMLSSKLMGISLELPSSRLTDTEPFKQPDIDETHFSNQNNPETLPLFLWQAPNSNAALYFGDKWVELHSFLARRLTAEEVAPGVSQDEKVISKRYPAFMEYLHELLRARGYYLLYPAFSAKGRFSVAKFHDDLFQFPEEFSDGNSEGLQQPKSAEMLLSGAPTLMPLLDTFSLELPDTSRLPILTDRGEEISSLVLERETENYPSEMAKEGERSAPADKGKGKVDDVKDLAGGKKDKPEEKTQANGKRKDDEPEEEELSEEDQQLKSELEMLVERLKESDTSLYGPALDAIKNFIKTSTSSMTAVPKPLKFLRPHYDDLATLYDEWSAGAVKDSLADMLSVLGMTYGDEEKFETLKYRLLTKSEDLGSWGHEYIRHLALEIGQEYQNRLNSEKDVQDLIDLALSLVPYFLRHNAEADAVDLLSELEIIEEIPRFVDENTYSRVCLYMVSMVNLLTYPEDQQFLQTAHEIYVRYKELTKAIILAIRLNDVDLIKSDINATSDQSVKKQMAFLVSRQQIWLDNLGEVEDDQTFMDCLNNTSIPKHFKSLGKELNILDPIMPEDIYKTHLETSRGAGLTNVDSARHNLASAFVNSFANAGFGNDKMMIVEGDKGPWVWKTKDDGMLSTTASMGMLLHRDVEIGLDKIDKYTYASEEHIKAGALLSIGILNSGVRIDSDPALALLSDTDNLEAKNVPMRVAAIMGLGLAYAGSNKEELLEALLPIVEDVSLDMQLSAMAAVSLGLIFVGSSNHQVSEAIATTLMDEERQKHLKDKWTRFMALGLALLYFGRQEEVDVILDILKAVDHPMAKPTSVLASVCAWAGTGTVLKLQELLHICNDVIEESDEKKGDELVQSYAVLGLSLIAMGEDVGQDMILRQFGHLMHYGASNIRKAVPLAMGLISPSNPQMKVYDTLSRYSHDNDNDVAINAIFAMGLCGAGTKNSRLAQLLRQLASYYHRDQNSLFMVRIAQGLLHMGKGTMTLNPFHTDRQVLSRVSAAGLLTVLVSLIDAKQFILAEHHYLLYFLITAMYPRFLVTLDEDLQPLPVNVRVGQAVDVVGQAGRPKTITGWQTQSTPVLLSHGERAELEDEQYIPLSSTLEGLVILRKNPDWEESST